MKRIALLLSCTLLLSCCIGCSSTPSESVDDTTTPDTVTTEPSKGTTDSVGDTVEEKVALPEQYPFPHNTAYEYGILPSVSQDEMNQAMLDMFEDWCEVYLTTEGCFEDEMRVSGGYGSYNMGTCSEGTGYGMLLMVYMANPDNDCHENYDDMYRFVKRHLRSGYGLMKWKINKNGFATDEWPAPDGDLDIALSLLMAHKQWGSDGEINYLEEAKTYVDNILKYAVNIPQYSIARGMLTDPSKHYSGFTMTSYQMPAHARLFGEVTENDEWGKVVDEIYSIMDYFYKLNPDASLTPYVFDSNTYGPVEGKGYTYSYDSCRVPWRIMNDFLWNGKEETELAYDMLNTNATWFEGYMKSISWNFDNVAASFNLDGTKAASYSSPRNIASMISLSAMSDASHQELLDKAYAYLSTQDMMHDHPGDYFQDTLMIMSMLMMTGNMPNFYDIEPHPDNKMLPVENSDTTAPSKPEGFQLTGTKSVSESEWSASFSWKACKDEGGKVVYRVYKDEYLYYATSKTSCTIRCLDANKTYEFKVVAVDESGNRTESDIITVTTK